MKISLSTSSLHCYTNKQKGCAEKVVFDIRSHFYPIKNTHLTLGPSIALFSHMGRRIQDLELCQLYSVSSII